MNRRTRTATAPPASPAPGAAPAPATATTTAPGAAPAPATATTTAPGAAPAPANNPDDPKMISLTRNLDRIAKIFTVTVRVLGEKGRGLKISGDLGYGMGLKKFTTNSRGTYVSKPITIPAGEKEVVVKGMVSGIEDPASLCLRLPREHQKSKYSSWDPRRNDGRARWFLIFIFIFWIFCLKIGPGELPFSGHVTELSEQQELYNQTIGQVDPASKFSPEQSRGTWQRWVWGFTIIWTLFAPLYAIFSLREEIAEEVAQILDRIADRPYVTARDPLMELIASWSGGLAVAKKAATDSARPPTATDSVQPSTADQAKGTPFWRLVKSEFLGEILAGILVPAVISAVKRK